MATSAIPARGSRQRALQALADLPPFSPVLDRLLAALANDNASVARISDIIETDTVIAGNVLKLVNSALYGRQGTVNSVRHAISLLGLDKLRNAVLALSITRVWKSARTAPGWSTARFNLHSVACGMLCDTLAQRVAVEYPEGAFTAGLFHDLGRLLIAVSLHPEYGQIERLHASGHGPLVECESEVLGLAHPELSASALAAWNLPAEIQQAVRFHHAPSDQPAGARGRGITLAQLVHCAGAWVSGNGMALSEEEDRNISPEPFAPLGIELASADFLEGYRAELQALSGLLHG